MQFVLITLEDDRFQPEYDKSIKYLDVTARINLLNRRLDVLKDLNTILMDAAQNHHAASLRLNGKSIPVTMSSNPPALNEPGPNHE